MLKLYFGDLFSVLTFIFVVFMLVFIVLTIKNRDSYQKWGRLMILFIVVGIAISGLSAMRDGYATANALFSMTSTQSNICSIAGGAIVLSGFVSIFLRNQKFRRGCFHIISALFVIQVLVIEASRIAFYI